MIKNNDAYRAAIAAIEGTKTVLEKTGGILGYGALPSGFIETTEEGIGKATFKIDIEGETKNISVKVHLSKRAEGEWAVHKLKYL